MKERLNIKYISPAKMSLLLHLLQLVMMAWLYSTIQILGLSLDKSPSAYVPILMSAKTIQLGSILG